MVEKKYPSGISADDTQTLKSVVCSCFSTNSFLSFLSLHTGTWQQHLMCKQMEIRINMKLCTTHSLSVCVASCRLAHSVAAAVLKDELVIGTVRTTRIHKQTVGSHSSCLCFLSLAPAFFFYFCKYPRCLPTSSNVFSIWGQLFTSPGFVPST